MPKNVKCKNCNNLVNHWCETVIDSPDEDMERDCQYFWLKTNADLIRSMPDEQLAVQLVWVSKEVIYALTGVQMPDEILNELRSHILDKLQQPAEVGNV